MTGPIFATFVLLSILSVKSYAAEIADYKESNLTLKLTEVSRKAMHRWTDCASKYGQQFITSRESAEAIATAVLFKCKNLEEEYESALKAQFESVGYDVLNSEDVDTRVKTEFLSSLDDRSLSTAKDRVEQIREKIRQMFITVKVEHGSH